MDESIIHDKIIIIHSLCICIIRYLTATAEGRQAGSSTRSHCINFVYQDYSEYFIFGEIMANLPQPSKGCFLKYMKQAMQPSIQISEAKPIVLSSNVIISGERYINVEFDYMYSCIFNFYFRGRALTLIQFYIALPKSHNLYLLSMIIRFQGFRSRWQTPMEWISYSAEEISKIIFRNYFWDNLWLLIQSNKEMVPNSSNKQPTSPSFLESIPALMSLTDLCALFSFSLVQIFIFFTSIRAYFSYICISSLFWSLIYLRAYMQSSFEDLHFHTSPQAPYANFDCLMTEYSPRVTMLDVEIRADPKQPHIDNINYKSKWHSVSKKKTEKLTQKRFFQHLGKYF